MGSLGLDVHPPSGRPRGPIRGIGQVTRPSPGFSPAGQVGSVAAVPAAAADRLAAASLARSSGPAAACPGAPTTGCRCGSCARPGRSLPEYRAVRGEGSILDAIRDPELAAEITLQPVRRYGVDAAILYSDIVVPGGRHRLRRRHRSRASGRWSSSLPLAPPTSSACARSTPRPTRPTCSRPSAILVAELAVPLIGFAGAPFTVASYLIEGRPSRTYARTKALMHGEPDAVARADGPPRRPGHRVAALAGRGRGVGRPAVRLVGRRAVARRLRALRPAPQPPGVRRASPTSACPASTSASTPASCSA